MLIVKHMHVTAKYFSTTANYSMTGKCNFIILCIYCYYFLCVLNHQNTFTNKIFLVWNIQCILELIYFSFHLTYQLVMPVSIILKQFELECIKNCQTCSGQFYTCLQKWIYMHIELFSKMISQKNVHLLS